MGGEKGQINVDVLFDAWTTLVSSEDDIFPGVPVET